MELMLELFDSAITFRARYQRHEDLLALTDLLVLDSANPRSLAGVLRRLRTELRKLPGGDDFIDTLLRAAAARTAPACSSTTCAAPTRRRCCACWARSARSCRPAAPRLADDLGHRFFAHASTGDELQRV